jgi:ribosomal protein S18 acetylase RimI-like enzyme
VIRPYRETDRDDVYDICVRTGASGADATGLYSRDALLPDIFAGPYVDYAPDLAFMVDTGERVAGYVVAVADTAAFVDWYERERLGWFAARYPVAGISPDEADMIENGLQPRRMLIPEVQDYPAHLHIDLLPELQGQGFGRQLIRMLIAELRDRGVPGVHLTMPPDNPSARAFYDRLGFRELPSSTAEAPVLGLATDAVV